MQNRLVLDTDVLIDYFRRNPNAIAFLDALEQRAVVSVITVAELFAGVRDGTERAELERFVSRSVLIDLDELICVEAGLMLRQYRKSHGVGLADALIAATAQSQHATLVSLNAKHFPMLPDLMVPYQRQ